MITECREYLGESLISTKGTPFERFGPKEWSLWIIYQYGMIDGEHHKQWLIDQVARILNGTSVELWEAKWSDGQTEYRPRVATGSEEYVEWAAQNYDDDDDCFDWDTGVAP